MNPAERGGYLKKLAALIRKHNDELAVLEARAMGKPLTQAIEGYYAADELDHYAEAWGYMQGSTSLNTPGHLSMILRQPYGVAAAIIPWNFPLVFVAGKAAPALIAGNTVVLKSSEKAPLACAKVAELVKEAGFPSGVFNIISGHGTPSGAVLSSHMDVRVLSFTGSGRTGRLIQEAAAKSNLKKVILELGGKSPALIFEDANIDKAVADTCLSLGFNAGQICMAISRIYVQKSVAPRFIEAFKKRFAAATHGDPTHQTTTQGPQADEIQYKNILSYIEEGKKAGGSLAIGGKGTFEKTNGYFIEPTVFLDSPEDSKITKEEIFGPVMIINTFETEDEACRIANDTEYGLHASVYTKDLDRAVRVAKALESGYVGVNCASPTMARDMALGGFKGSGQGREGWMHSLDNFLEVKTVMIQFEQK